MKTFQIQTSSRAETKPPLLANKAGELSLSGEALLELLRDVINKGMPFRFRARGSSMSPFIKDGDLITISPTPDDSNSIGDVIAYICPRSKKLIVHRVVGKKGESLLVKGDYGPDGKEFVLKANILGRVRKVERNGEKVLLGLGPERYLISFLSRGGFLLSFLSPLWRLVRPFAKRWPL
jgi:hypothetical protein